MLDRAVWFLRGKARRELRMVLDPIDECVLARTVNDPFAARDLPWWQRRIEI